VEGMGWDAFPSPNRPPGCRMGPGVAARGSIRRGASRL